jgi:hypothetical protein
VQNFLLEDGSSLNQRLFASRKACSILRGCSMQKMISVIVQNPTVRAAVLIVLVAAISLYLGTSPVRRGILYHIGVFAPSLVAAIGAGLSA